MASSVAKYFHPLPNRKALGRYCHDGALEIDKNGAERSQRLQLPGIELIPFQSESCLVSTSLGDTILP